MLHIERFILSSSCISLSHIVQFAKKTSHAEKKAHVVNVSTMH